MTKFLKANTGNKNERGFSLLEAMVASFIMLVGIGGLMALFTIAAAKNAGQGDQATRTTEYAQDKMEQLLALTYGDNNSQVAGPTTIPVGGTGYLAGSGLTSPGGGVDPANPVATYVDYVTSQGTISTSATSALYIREWMIATDTVRNVKTITVVVSAKFSADVGPGMKSLAPSTTLIAVKEPF